MSSGASAQTLNTLVAFGGGNGATPEDRGRLIADTHGNLFGTTASGGTSNACTGGCDTVFEVKVDSTTATGYASTPTTLVSFNGTDGAYPLTGLIADASGNLFGTTCGRTGSCVPGGGVSCVLGCGTVFEIKVDGTTATGYASTPTTLVSFNQANGQYPFAGVIMDASGTVFEVTGSGFVPPVTFAGTPGTPNCVGVTDSVLAQTYGGIADAAASLGYPSVMALQIAVKAYCERGE